MYGSFNKCGLLLIRPDFNYKRIDSAFTPKPIEVAPAEPVAVRVNDYAETPADGEEIDTDDDSEWDSDSDSFASTQSSDEEEQELTEEQRRVDREARALERQRVLEAAGLVIAKSDKKPPPRPARRRSTRKHRPAPAVPHSHRRAESKDLPSLPSPSEPEHDVGRDNSLRLDDAFERYEAYKTANAGAGNRLSTISVDTSASLQSSTPSLTVIRSPSLPALRSPSADPSETGGRSHSNFFSFFGRSKTPGESSEGRVMPVISGPIPMGSEFSKDGSMSPGLNASDSGFGTSWASLVDRSALEEIPPKERKRQEAIFEFVATESAYVRDLQLIVEVFYTNLIPILDQKATTVIFANIEDILLTNTTFLSSLEERQKECRLYIDRIGDILKNNISHMGVYMEYCINQSYAIKVLQSLREGNPELASTLQRLRDEPIVRNLDLSSYLLVPMQRITRYPLLIKQVLHYSEVEEERRQVEAALEMSEKILSHINETIREQEGRERLKTISRDLWIGEGRLDLTAPTRTMGMRKLLREGILVKAKSGRRLRAFLCSDILVLTEESVKALYRMPIPLSEIQVREAPGGRDDLVFQIALAYPRGGDKINFKATSARDCQLWMQALEKASHECRQAEMRAAKRRQSRLSVT